MKQSHFRDQWYSFPKKGKKKNIVPQIPNPYNTLIKLQTASKIKGVW